MKKINPYEVSRMFKRLKYNHPYFHTMAKSFFIIMAVLIAFLIFFLPQALCVWLNAPDCIFLYLLVIPFLLGYAHFAIDCLDY